VFQDGEEAFAVVPPRLKIASAPCDLVGYERVLDSLFYRLRLRLLTECSTSPPRLLFRNRGAWET